MCRRKDFLGFKVRMLRMMARTRTRTGGTMGSLFAADAMFELPNAEGGEEEGFGSGQTTGGGEGWFWSDGGRPIFGAG